jgi:hypothetical protein
MRFATRLLSTTLAAAVIIAAPTRLVWALINPNYTPADLVVDSERILLLKVSFPKDNRAVAEVVETIVGEAWPDKVLTLSMGEPHGGDEQIVASAFHEGRPATAVLFLKKADQAGPGGGEKPAGYIQINAAWFAVYRVDNRFWLDKDKDDISAVWAGSAAMLARAVRYAHKDLGARFPVRAELSWSSDLQLGKLGAPPNGVIAADFGGTLGACAVVLCDVGDRIYRTGENGAPPADITEKTKLATASKLAATADLNGDGRIDLALWDGRQLRLALQTATGTFEVHAADAHLKECMSLATFDAGEKRGVGLIAGTAAGPIVLVPAGDAAYTATLLANESPRALGQTGVFVVADCDNDGRADIIQVGKEGVAVHAGRSSGTFAAPEVSKVDLPCLPRMAVVGDYDGDGNLDLVVAGKGSLTLLRRDESGQWENITYATGELAYHGNQSEPTFTALAPCDPNLDGRQGVAAFYADRKPMLFFNRGFGCFGWARELDPSGGESMQPASQTPAAFEAHAALSGGQSAGMILDLNGDLLPDMLGVDGSNRVWAIFTRTARAQTNVLTIAAAVSQRGPLTVAIHDGKRVSGAYLIEPGHPAHIGRERRGPVTLSWKDAAGKETRRTVVVLKSMRVEIP